MNKLKGHSIDVIFMLLLFSIFAISSLMVILIGANVYQSIVGDMDDNNEIRASLTYISNKVKLNNTGDSVQIEQIDGVDVLTIYGGFEDKTCIYFHDGSLKEVLVARDDTIDIGVSGFEIISVKDFDMSYIGDNLIQFDVTASGGESMELMVGIS